MRRMIMYRKSMLLLSALALVALVVFGCSSDNGISPGSPGQDPGLSASPNDPSASGSVLEMLEEMRTRIQPADPQPLSEGSFSDVKDVMRQHGVEMPLALDKAAAPLPPPLLVASMASAAINAVNTGTTWAPLTHFLKDGDRFWGFEVAWLEPFSDPYCPNAYYCNYYLDRLVPSPLNPIYVTPYASVIYDSAVRVVNALADPKSCINRSYNSGGYVVYDYIFDYPSNGVYHRVEFLRFRLCIQ